MSIAVCSVFLDASSSVAPYAMLIPCKGFGVSGAPPKVETCLRTIAPKPGRLMGVPWKSTVLGIVSRGVGGCGEALGVTPLK